MKFSKCKEQSKQTHHFKQTLQWWTSQPSQPNRLIARRSQNVRENRLRDFSTGTFRVFDFTLSLDWICATFFISYFKFGTSGDFFCTILRFFLSNPNLLIKNEGKSEILDLNVLICPVVFKFLSHCIHFTNLSFSYSSCWLNCSFGLLVLNFG